MADEIVPELIVDGEGIRRAARPVEAMGPAKPGQAKRPPASPAELLEDVALFTPKPPEPRVEAKPGVLATRERAQVLHRDVERLALGINASGIGRPDAQHLVPPDWIEVG